MQSSFLTKNEIGISKNLLCRRLNLRGSGQKSLLGTWPKQFGNRVRTGFTWGDLLLCYITHAICQSTGVHPGAIFSSFFTASEQQGPAGRVAALLGYQFSNCSIFQLLEGGLTVFWQPQQHSKENWNWESSIPETTGIAQKYTPFHRICLRLLSLLLARLRRRWGNLGITKI